MKKILTLITGFFALHSVAQQFESADDALMYLDDHFESTTRQTKGEVWVDPIMLQFEKDAAIYIHVYKGHIAGDDFVSGQIDNSGLVQEPHNNYADHMIWDDMKSVTLQKNDKNEYWITLTGPVIGQDNKVIAQSRTFFVYEAGEAEKIKAALEYAIAHVGE